MQGEKNLQQEKALKGKSCANRDFSASQEHRLTPSVAGEWEAAQQATASELVDVPLELHQQLCNAKIRYWLHFVSLPQRT